MINVIDLFDADVVASFAQWAAWFDFFGWTDGDTQRNELTRLHW